MNHVIKNKRSKSRFLWLSERFLLPYVRLLVEKTLFCTPCCPFLERTFGRFGKDMGVTFRHT